MDAKTSLGRALRLQEIIDTFDSGDLNKSFKNLKDIQENEPGFIDAFELEASFLYRLNKLDEAEKACKLVLTKTSNSARSRMILGCIYSCNGDNESAIKEYEKAISINPQLKEARKLLADCLFLTENYNESENQYMQIRQLNPAIMNSLGIIKTKQGKYHDAVICFEEAARYDNNVIYLSNSASAHFQMGATRHAIEIYENLYSSSSIKNRDYCRGYVNSLLSAKELGKARKIISDADECFSEEYWLLHLKGVLLLNEEKYEESLLMFDKALEKEKNFPQSILSKGVCLRKVGKNLDALEMFSTLVEEYNKKQEFNVSLVVQSLQESILILKDLGMVEESDNCIKVLDRLQG